MGRIYEEVIVIAVSVSECSLYCMAFMRFEICGLKLKVEEKMIL